MITGESIEAAAEKACEVGARHEAKEEAGAEVRRAQAEVLARLCRAVHPALKAMSSPILAGVFGRLSERPEQRERRMLGGMRGCPACAAAGPALHGRGVAGVERGTVGGRALYLLESWACGEPEFVELRYSGTWDAREDVVEWASTEETLTTASVIERKWPLVDVVEALADALESQYESKTERRTERMLRQAERLRAVEVLLRGEP